MTPADAPGDRPEEGVLRPRDPPAGHGRAEGRGRRFLFYSNESIGLGHLRRSLTLARTASQGDGGSSALVVTGSQMVSAYRLPPRVESLKLPAGLATRTASGGPQRRPIGSRELSRVRARGALAVAEELRRRRRRGGQGAARVLDELVRSWRRSSRVGAGSCSGCATSRTAPTNVRRRGGPAMREAIERYYETILVYGPRVPDATRCGAWAGTTSMCRCTTSATSRHERRADAPTCRATTYWRRSAAGRRLSPARQLHRGDTARTASCPRSQSPARSWRRPGSRLRSWRGIWTCRCSTSATTWRRRSRARAASSRWRATTRSPSCWGAPPGAFAAGCSAEPGAGRPGPTGWRRAGWSSAPRPRPHARDDARSARPLLVAPSPRPHPTSTRGPTARRACCRRWRTEPRARRHVPHRGSGRAHTHSRELS